MNHKIGFLFLGIIVLFFLWNCEKANKELNAPSFASLENVANTVSTEKTTVPVASIESLPTEVKWWWRRVQVDGDLSTNGANNINGTARGISGDLDYGNFSFEELRAGYDTPKWWACGYAIRSSVEKYLGDYSVRLRNLSGSINKRVYLDSDYNANTLEYYDTGQTVYAGDSVFVNTRGKLTAGDVENYYVRVLLGKATDLNTNTQNDSIYQNASSTWAEYGNITVVPSGWSEYAVASVRLFALYDPATFYIDDVRMYSSASQMTPAANVLIPTSTTLDMEEEDFNASGLCSPMNTTTFDIAFFFEDPEDGLYYQFSAWQARSAPKNTYAYEGSLTSEALTAIDSYSSLELLTASRNTSSGYEVHINETQRFVLNIP